MFSYKKNPIPVILLLTVFIRLILFAISYSQGESSFYLFDSYRYLGLGKNLFESGLYTEKLTDPVFESIFVTPGAPVLFYFLKSIGGIPAIIIFQIICQTITCYLLLKIVPIIFPQCSKRVIHKTGFAFALDIPTIVLGNVIMTETIFTTLLFAFIYFFVKYFEKKSLRFLILASILLGISALFRPIILYFPILLFIISLIIFRPFNLDIIKQLASLFIPFYLIIGLWMFSNYRMHGYFFYSYQGEFNLGYYQAADIYSEKYSLNLEEAREKFIHEVRGNFDPSEYQSMDQVKFYSAFGKKAREVIIENPIHFLKNMAKANVFLFFRPVRDYLKISLGSKELFHTRSKNQSIPVKIMIAWQILVNILVFLLLPFGFIHLYKINRNLFYFFLGFIIYFILICSGPEIDARFRVPMIPVLLILSASGVLFLMEKFSRKDVTDAQDNSTFAS
jgi:4-amino-4-deoxy-L-arabinose transferase-like glycosyltransferase